MEIGKHGLPEGANDSLTTSTLITFGRWDALKHFLGWRLSVRATAFVERPVGRVVGETLIDLRAEAPRWWRRLARRKQFAYVADDAGRG